MGEVAEAHPRRGRARASRSGHRITPTDQVLACIRYYESRGNYRAVSSSGKYRGAYQFDQRTWEGLGAWGDPAEAPPWAQDWWAAVLVWERGLQPWPTPNRRCRG